MKKKTEEGETAFGAKLECMRNEDLEKASYIPSEK